MPEHASPEGTRRFRERQPAAVAAAHFRTGYDGLTASSIGIGTYLGAADDSTDAAYEQALAAAFRLGTNVVDTAINYRAQRSERAIGRALRAAIERGDLRRDEVVVCTKGGYLPVEGGSADRAARAIHETYVQPGLLEAGDIVGGCHAMTPRYLDDQIERSRRNLGIEVIDVYYLHNPETQLGELSRAEFERRIARAFGTLEQAARDGRIARYGVATWNGFRIAPSERQYLALSELVALAEGAGGAQHHFRALQLPCNLAMTEACTERTQRIGQREVSLVECAEHHGLTVAGSAALLQGRLTQGLPDVLAGAMTGCHTDAQRALQFARSTPGITVALAGMSTREHVESNLALARIPPATQDAYLSLFTARE
jgi:aryl-alcohol dehydrogenase-like predicted oxidoreductase